MENKFVLSVFRSWLSWSDAPELPCWWGHRSPLSTVYFSKICNAFSGCEKYAHKIIFLKIVFFLKKRSVYKICILWIIQKNIYLKVHILYFIKCLSKEFLCILSFTQTYPHKMEWSMSLRTRERDMRQHKKGSQGSSEWESQGAQTLNNPILLQVGKCGKERTGKQQGEYLCRWKVTSETCNVWGTCWQG